MFARGTTLLSAALAMSALTLVTACAADDGPRLRVLTAASLADAFETLAPVFEAETGIEVELSVGPSSGLREQIRAGAPADVFASASTEEIADLDEDGEVVRWEVFARNELVLAVPADNPGAVSSLDDLADPELLVGVCDAAVPCGRLARSALAAAGVTAAIDTNASDVRALRTQLLSGDLDVGLVYRTDIVASDGRLVEIGLPAPARVASDDAIAVLRAARDEAAAVAFMDFVSAPAARAVLAAAGFSAP